MSDVQGIILHNVLKHPDSLVDIWPKLKVYFFNQDYSHIYLAITKYYNKHQKLPTFDELILTTRDNSLVQKLESLKLLEIPEDIDNGIVTEALTDQFTQDRVLDQLLKFLNKLPLYDTQEVKESIANILRDLEEKTEDPETIVLMDNIFVLDAEEEHNRIPLGINNDFDVLSGGIALTDLWMFGGFRGSGKTVLASNIICNQYMQGNIGLIFSIEMRYREIFNRFISILANADNSRVSKRTCTYEELERIALVRANMFEDSQKLYEDYLEHRDYQKFEIELLRTKTLLPESQLIIVDNKNLTLTDIDMVIRKFKLKYGDKLKTAVVDYVNQIEIEDIFDWKSQIKLSKGLKNIAREHEIGLISPYQIDKTGEVRFAKGLLDAADVAANLTAYDNYLNIKSTKTRNIRPFEFNAPIDWETLRISPQNAIIEEVENTNKQEESSDLPAWT